MTLAQFDEAELLARSRRDLENGRIEEALLKLKKLMTQATPYVDAFPVAARVYGQLGLLDKARDCYQHYVKAKPEATLEYFELGVTYFESGDKNEAKKIWDTVLVKAPTHPPTLFYSGLLAAQDGRMPDAHRNLDVLIKSTPADNLYVTRARELLKDLERPAQEKQ